FDMLLDSCTSIVVLWRYFNKSTANTKGKEHKAIIILGILFIVFSIVITVKCVIALVEKTVTAEELILAGMSAVAAVVMTTLAIIKFIIARKLKSRSICCDAFSSAMGAVISYGIILSAIIYANLQIWYIDAIVGILVAVVLAGWGIWVLVNEIQEMKASG
ncbi:transmembrane protein 163a-like, partial [Saccoglossus kowalevskii]|uniref:Transmembrane protein 163-like n=1 Tax=Saccoglossus kowalevskii TaxID=10224 RepID=A0ABM0MQX6_SACKO